MHVLYPETQSSQLEHGASEGVKWVTPDAPLRGQVPSGQLCQPPRAASTESHRPGGSNRIHSLRVLEAGHPRASLVAQLVKNPPAMRETWVPSLGWEDPLEKGTATHPSILAWRNPWTV